MENIISLPKTKTNVNLYDLSVMKYLFLALLPILGYSINTNQSISNSYSKSIFYRIDGGKTEKSCMQLSLLLGKIDPGNKLDIILPKNTSNVNFLCVSINSSNDNLSDEIVFKVAYNLNCKIDILGPKNFVLSPDCKIGLTEK